MNKKVKQNKNIKQIILIQKIIRGYLTRKNILIYNNQNLHLIIPQSSYQTKIWRKNKVWYKNGKSNECEKY